MVCSMTGYGQSKIDTDQFSLSVEIRSVNHRFLDIHIRSSESFLRSEDKIRKTLQKYLKRGRIDVVITIDRNFMAKKKLHIDWNLIDDYYQFINTLKEKYSLRSDIQLEHFLNRNEMIEIHDHMDENEELEEILIQTIEEAAKNVLQMRKREGNELQKEVIQQLTLFEQQWGELVQHAPQCVKKYQEQLYKKVEQLTNGLVDEGRILTEVAIFADRIDIREELTRLKSHLSQFYAILEEKEPIGRKIDFLIQEMNREVNTIGSKGNDSFISQKVVEMKSILEKLREQVQNIE